MYEGRLTGGKGWGRLKLAPGKGTRGVSASAAVSATALAGCGRGRDGRGCEEWRRSSTRAPRVRHGRDTPSSRDSYLVTESVGSPRFRACWATVTTAMHGLTTRWCGQLTQRVSGPLI